MPVSAPAMRSATKSQGGPTDAPVSGGSLPEPRLKAAAKEATAKQPLPGSDDHHPLVGAAEPCPAMSTDNEVETDRAL